MKVTGTKNKTDLYKIDKITPSQRKDCEKFIARRQSGAPLQYVIGETCFYGYDIKCDARALIPRFDTEIVADEAIKLIKKIPKAEVLDLCTGTGAIAIAIKKNCDCTVTATDISRDALLLCEENRDLSQVDFEILCGSLFRPVKKRKFDLIVSNPPYIPSGDIATLDKEVKEFEPRLALDGGADGLDYYRDIISGAVSRLKKGGYLVLEAGINQAELIKGIAEEKYECEFVKDMNDPPIDRVVILKLKDEYFVEENKE